jgi:ribonucleotide reductase, class II
MPAHEFPSDAPAANPVFYRTYSRRDQGPRESWRDTVSRNLQGLRKLGHLSDPQVELLAQHQEDLTCLPSGRWLWVGGTDWIENPANFSGAYNCTSSEIIDWHAVALMMDLAMMGSGTGAVLEARCTDQLPIVRNALEVEVSELGTAKRRSELTQTTQFDTGHIRIAVGDSRQGWVRALQQLLNLSSNPLLKERIRVEVDLSSVRPPGEPLKGFGGTANPIQLPGLFERAAAILAKAQGRRLKPIEVCLLIDEAAKTVVAGNIRRSAGMRQFDADDEEAAAAKDGLWTQDEAGNWRIDPERDALRMANHTRVFHTRPSYEELLASITRQHASGEGAIQFAPAALVRANADLLNSSVRRRTFLEFYISDGWLGRHRAKSYLRSLGATDEKELDHRMKRYGLNPCGEIIGSDFHCNLAEIHLNRLDPEDLDQVTAAFQAGALSVAALLHHRFSEPRYQFSREIDPIVGVSFTGLFDFFVSLFGVEWLQWWAEGRPSAHEAALKRGTKPELCEYFRNTEAEHLCGFRQIVEETVWDYCTEHGLRMPNRCTTVQPAGTKSLLTNASPGWHPPKAARFIRRITFGKEDPVALACMLYGYSVIPSQSDKDENGQLLDDPHDPRCTEWLVEIPVEATWANLPGADQIDISRFSALAQYDFYMQVQKHYTTHNTSATIEFTKAEIEPLAKRIHQDIQSPECAYISAALLARSECKETFPRMPFEPIDQATYERLHAAVLERRTSEDFLALLGTATHGEQPGAEGPAGCDSDACMLPLAQPE